METLWNHSCAQTKSAKECLEQRRLFEYSGWQKGVNLREGMLSNEITHDILWIQAANPSTLCWFLVTEK